MSKNLDPKFLNTKLSSSHEYKFCQAKVESETCTKPTQNSVPVLYNLHKP